MSLKAIRDHPIFIINGLAAAVITVMKVFRKNEE